MGQRGAFGFGQNGQILGRFSQFAYKQWVLGLGLGECLVLLVDHGLIPASGEQNHVKLNAVEKTLRANRKLGNKSPPVAAAGRLPIQAPSDNKI